MARKLGGRHDVRQIQKDYGKSKFFNGSMFTLFSEKFERKLQREERLISSAVSHQEYERFTQAETNGSTSGNTNIASQSLYYRSRADNPHIFQRNGIV